MAYTKTSGIRLDPMNYVTRKKWQAEKAKTRQAIETPIHYVIFTYTNSIPCENKKECINRVQEIQNCNMHVCKLGDIKYSFLIGGDGRVYEGRGWYYTPNKVDIQDRYGSIANEFYDIAFICRNDEEPTEEMKAAADAVIQEGMDNDFLAKNIKVSTLWKEYTIPKCIRERKDVEIYVPPDKIC